MFGIGTFEFLVIILVAVLVLGPEQLPRVVRTVTKVMSDFRRISTDFQRAVNLQANQEDYRRKHGDDAFQAANNALGIKKKKKKKRPDGPVEGEAGPLTAKKAKRRKKADAAPADAQTAVAQTAPSAVEEGQAPPAQAATPDSDAAAAASGPAVTAAAASDNGAAAGGAPDKGIAVASVENTAPFQPEEDTEVLEERFRQIRESLRSRGIDPDSVPTQGGRA